MAFLLKFISRGIRLAAPLRRNYNGLAGPLVFSKEVRDAKAENKPVVALESTIISHGMPYPHNLTTALEVENIIRQRGAIPATVAILNGQLTVGLTEDELRYLAQAKGVVKVSRRDMAPVIAAKLDGATTVAGTIIAAELADISVFVTGGIGGVHRYGESTLDISADLTELSRSKTLVVCSGVKSILDIGRTLEYLETQGVCVCSFGESDDFPAFYTVKSGHRAPHRVPDALHAARLLHSSRLLQLSSGILIAVPLPQEYAMDESLIENAINRALEASKEKGIQGKEVTPFVLSAVASVTHGASLDANIALVKNNARVGADIAVEFKKIKNMRICEKKSNETHTVTRREFHTSCHVRASEDCKGKDVPLFAVDKHAKGDVLVIGGANVDRVYRLAEDKIQLDGSTHACAAVQCGGGVGRNMAEALWRLQRGRTRLLTAVGDDVHGTYLANIAPGLLLDGCIVNGGRTPSYAAILDSKGECLLGLGDMGLHNHITIDLVNKHIEVLKDAPLVVIDGNPPQETINHVLKLCHELQKPVFFEPTDRRKAIKAIHGETTVTYTSPNLKELRAMANYLEPINKIKKTHDLNEISALSRVVSKYFKCLIVTMGSKGVVIVNNLNDDSENITFYPVNVLEHIENVSGAGDCFASGFINGILLGYTESQCIYLGLESAKLALLSKNTVPCDLHTIKLKQN